MIAKGRIYLVSKQRPEAIHPCRQPIIPKTVNIDPFDDVKIVFWQGASRRPMWFIGREMQRCPEGDFHVTEGRIYLDFGHRCDQLVVLVPWHQSRLAKVQVNSGQMGQY